MAASGRPLKRFVGNGQPGPKRFADSVPANDGFKARSEGERFVLNLCWEALQWQRRDFFVRPVLLFMEKFFVPKRLKESFILRLAIGSAG